MDNKNYEQKLKKENMKNMKKLIIIILIPILTYIIFSFVSLDLQWINREDIENHAGYSIARVMFCILSFSGILIIIYEK